MRVPPPRPPPATNATFISPNKLFSFTVDEDASVVSRNRELSFLGTMKKAGSPTKLWSINFEAPNFQSWSPSYFSVSDDGSFVVIPFRPSHWLLLKESRSVRIPDFFSSQTSYLSHDTQIVDLDRLNNTNIVRIWNGKEDKWIAFLVDSETVIKPSAEEIARWNESTRQKILDSFRRAEANALRKKIGAAVSQKLSELAQTAIPATNPGDLREAYFEFLARRQNAEDRALFARLLRADESEPLRPPIVGNSMFRFILAGPTRDAIEHEIPLRRFADAMLALHEGKSKQSLPFSTTLKPAYLGEISVIVRLPTPILDRDGFLRVHLVSPDRVSQKWIDDQHDSLEISAQSSTVGRFDLMDEVIFHFKTTPPGKYMAKAIWDKRRPHTDLDSAGPGDYESQWIGPIEVTPLSTTNIFVECNSPAAGAETYYAADRLVQHQWKNTGELTLLNHTTQRYEADHFSAPPRNWITKTNFISPELKIDLTRFAVHGPVVSAPRPNDWPRYSPFNVIWRPSQPNVIIEDDPIELRIIDSHGCEFFSTEMTPQGRSKVVKFPIVPRSQETWRLVGYARDDQGTLLFDFTLANHARIDPIPLIPAKLPLEIKLQPPVGELSLHVDRLVHTNNTIWMESKCIENGVISTNWSIPGISFADPDGNIIEPGQGCHRHTVLRVFGALHQFNKQLPFEFVVDSAAVPQR